MAKISTVNGKMIGQDQKAYLGICQMLFNNELHPGQKLAGKDLAQRLGVSTTPVIHALKLLEHKGIVRRETNRGYFINTITIQEVDEIFDARLALEVSLLSKTLKHLDHAALKKLEDALHAHDEAVAVNDHAKRVMTDLRYHMTLASISRTNIQVTLLEDLFDRLLLKFSKDLGYKVTYHDPCYLGRYNGIYDAPRRVIEATGCEIVEMPRNRDCAFCCGAGGGRIWMEEGEIRERPSESRIREAVALENVTDFIVACPKDVTMYSDAVKTAGAEESIVVKDLIELVYEAL